MPENRRVTVKFFALLREQAGCREVTLDTTASTPAALHAELAQSEGEALVAELEREFPGVKISCVHRCDEMCSLAVLNWTP